MVLGASWGALGRSWGALGRSKFDQKIDPKLDSKTSRIATGKIVSSIDPLPRRPNHDLTDLSFPVSKPLRTLFRNLFRNLFRSKP